MRSLLVPTALLGLLAACPSVYLCRTADDLWRFEGRRVEVVGVYRPLAVPIREGGRSEHLGHAAIVIEDLELRLGRTPRPLEELAQLQGKTVIVEGRLSLRLPPPTLEEPGEIRVVGD